jgi:hypothetical protein
LYDVHSQKDFLILIVCSSSTQQGMPLQMEAVPEVQASSPAWEAQATQGEHLTRLQHRQHFKVTVS